MVVLFTHFGGGFPPLLVVIGSIIVGTFVN